MIIAVIQARVGSSRLPGKALLPIRGYPTVVLAAKRAANLGLHVLVAAPDCAQDDQLVAILRENDLRVVRGPLDDVLKRFVIATEDLPESAVVVRLTADNLFPDGAFLAELADEFQRTGRAYLGAGSPADGLPYGLSAEAFTVHALREANRQATTAVDREHVTPWLRRQYPGTVFLPKDLHRDIGHLRCTIDCLSDYEQVARAFSSVEDPVAAHWLSLCQALERNLPSPQLTKRLLGSEWIGEFVLGTAQLGLPAYGRTNTTGRPEPSAAVHLIRTAIRHGVDCLDTARAYEQAEKIVGEAVKPFGNRIQIVTKLSTLSDLPEEATSRQVCTAVDSSVFRSCRELGIASLPVLLLHRWALRTSHRGVVWERLRELKSEGLIGRLGVSVYAPEEAKAALNEESIQHLQIPFNLLDRRWEQAGIDRLAAERSDVVVHARSILLQGILASGPEFWPQIAGVNASAMVKRLEALASGLGRATRTDLCLAFARAQSWIHGLVIGVESAAQLADLLQLFQRQPLNAAEQGMVRRTFPAAAETLLNPALWPVQ